MGKMCAQPLRAGNCTAELGVCFRKSNLPALSKDSCTCGN